MVYEVTEGGKVVHDVPIRMVQSVELGDPENASRGKADLSSG